jgi:hypothetical protein
MKVLEWNRSRNGSFRRNKHETDLEMKVLEGISMKQI